MTVSPFSPGSYAARRTGESFTTMRRELDELQRQLATGKRSDTFSGLGLGRRTSLDVRAKLSALEGYQSTIADGALRLKLMSNGLESLSKTSGELKAAVNLPFQPGADGRTPSQITALNNLRHAVDVLNTDVNGRYLFGGREDGRPPVLTDIARLLDGAGAEVGLRDAIAQRRDQEWLSGNAGGWLDVGGGGADAQISRPVAGTSGFSIPATPAPTGSANIAVIPAPGTIGFSVTAQPAAGETVRFELGLPDGTRVPVTLTARPPGSPAFDAASFAIGLDENGTAANLRNAMRAAIDGAKPALDAAAAFLAADAFFAGDVPSSVDWYQGETGTLDPPEAYSLEARAGVQARVGASQAVGIGARADEKPFRDMLASLAVIAAETFSAAPVDRPAESARHAALMERVRARLDPPVGNGGVKDVTVDLASASVALEGARQRNIAAKAVWEDAIAGVEDVPKEEVAASILALQTQLQASYQVTAILSRLSIVDYL